MTTKTKTRTRKGLSGVAAALTLLGFMTVVTTAIASETIQRKPEKIPTSVKYAGAGLAFATSAGLLVLRNTKFDTRG